MIRPIPTTEKWVRELALAAENYRLVDSPRDFHTWPEDRKAEWCALAVCDLKRRAAEGDKAATDFFRVYCHWPSPPSPKPKPPPAAGKPLRVGIVTPGLAMGGAELWTVTMTARPIPGIHWAGVATEATIFEWPGAWSIRQKCPVLLGGGSVRLLAHGCDVLIIWGWNAEQFHRLLGDERPPVVICFAQGACDWTRAMVRGNEGWADYRAAVSGPAARTFGDGAKVEVLWNGVDPARVDPVQGRAATRAAWGLGPREKAVLYLGRFSPEKRPTAVCAACAALGNAYRPVLVGDGWKAAETIAEARRLNPRTILPGPCDLPGDSLAAADVFFLASPSEGFSIAMIEAWLAGVPVAATRVGAVPELEARFGSLVTPIREPLEPRQMAAAVKEATGRKGRKRARNALRVAQEHFTADRMRERWEAFLRRIRDEQS